MFRNLTRKKMRFLATSLLIIACLLIFNCEKNIDISQLRGLKTREDFYVLTNFIEAEKSFGYYDSVTFASPADYRFLDNLEFLTQRWNGPISVSLYTPGDDFLTTLREVKRWRECGNPRIKETVSFHLFFEQKHIPSMVNKANISEVTVNCSDKLSSPKTYKNIHDLPFPINVARNVAKEESKTHFILIADIELYPAVNFTDNFVAMMRRLGKIFSNKTEVFVLPVFEVVENSSIPATKSELQEIYDKTAFIFHKKLCSQCHKIPGFKEWILANPSAQYDIFKTAKRSGKHKQWEPFYVSTKDIPIFDERLTWEGQSNKMTQNYLMCLLDYDYLILNDAFLIHKPGIKKKKTQLTKYGKFVRETNRLIKNVILPEYHQLFGFREGCGKKKKNESLSSS